ncbi:MaoC/PaaZ C-terminal domain-containing protein [Pseudonocardia sp. WMMC193]|uniref:MaoC/PaaZ C-terminal domain-containing protein n=1 Tax=Pseudonocardia sp. WMMC193 TaxID=2911965 RepID=UPI001F1CDAA8|nr:MaoC/PaaZ C-terminal domain-containing protein [Pseudonocardia sp. WMMC193]MCF7553073.1 dehydratase [Pseudonocardia sp. WMMC193]
MSEPDPVVAGTELPPLELRFTRADLVRYAGASGDLNPIHWSDRVAGIAGLPGVIAHGMLTLGAAGRIVTDWVGDPARIRSYGARFTRPVLVPDDDEGATVLVTARVTGVSDGIAKVDIKAVYDGKGVLGRAQAEVLLPE